MGSMTHYMQNQTPSDDVELAKSMLADAAIQAERMATEDAPAPAPFAALDELAFTTERLDGDLATLIKVLAPYTDQTCAVLHDQAEDAPIPRSQLEARIWNQRAQIVELCTRVEDLLAWLRL